MVEIALIVHNVRSCYNVGSILRTAEGLGVKEVYLTGYTPYPILRGDTRPPHIALKVDRQIHKTALGAELFTKWSYSSNVINVISMLKHQGFSVAALEQDISSTSLPAFRAKGKLAIIVGREVEGIESEVLLHCDKIIEIPMQGKKESFNVAAATAIVLYHCVYFS